MNWGTTRLRVHTGRAMVGNYGGRRSCDYTAYGDTITAAARLEGANKFLGTRICVSATVANATANFKGRPVGDLMLRGRSEPLRAYEPLQAGALQGSGAQPSSEAIAQCGARGTAPTPSFAPPPGRPASQ